MYLSYYAFKLFPHLHYVGAINIVIKKAQVVIHNI